MSVFGLFKSENSDVDKIRFMDSLAYPITMILSHFKAFLALAGIFSLVVSLVTFFCGRGFLCGFQVGSFCKATVFSSVLSVLVNLSGMAFLINRWTMVINEKKSIKDILLAKCFAKDVKAVGVILLYFILWCGIGYCFYFLKQRIVTPNWLFELGFFVIFSSVIVFCLILLLNFVGFYHYLQGGTFFSLRKTIGQSYNNLYTLILVFFIYMLIFIYFIYRGEMLFRQYAQYGISFEYGSEFYLYFIFSVIITVFVSSFHYQEKKLFREE